MEGLTQLAILLSAMTVVGSVLAGTESFTTTEGLANPGDVATYRVYVILNTGNESGSNDVTITRVSGDGVSS